MSIRRQVASLLAIAGCLIAGAAGWAQDIDVTGRVVPERAAKTSSAGSSVVWLEPVGAAADTTAVAPMHAVLAQKNKAFDPHLLVVTRGSAVEFPNHDPWFHNVFSLFNGKRFDLGLYEAGSSRTVHFDRVGISYIFCNIHPEMSAVIVVLPSPYFAVPNKQGEFSIDGVPAGRYMFHIWNENALPAVLQALSHEVQVSNVSRSLGSIRVAVTLAASVPHKNKYGKDYEPPSPNNPVYVQP
jgi:plastocyanin